MQFESIAIRHRWSEAKKLDRLLSCLTDKALEFAFKCKMNTCTSFSELKSQLKLRFDLSDEPEAARQKLNNLKQEPDETLNVATTATGILRPLSYNKWPQRLFSRGAEIRGPLH